VRAGVRLEVVLSLNPLVKLVLDDRLWLIFKIVKSSCVWNVTDCARPRTIKVRHFVQILLTPHILHSALELFFRALVHLYFTDPWLLFRNICLSLEESRLFIYLFGFTMLDSAPHRLFSEGCVPWTAISLE
jgi:hypothetical protein